MDTDRSLTPGQLEALAETLCHAEALAQCYQNAAMAMPSRACGNAAAQLAERLEALVVELREERDWVHPPLGPSAPFISPHHLFTWHLAENDAEQSVGMARAIHDAEHRLRRNLDDLRASGPLPQVVAALVERGFATIDDDVDRVRLGRCLGETDALAARSEWPGLPDEGITGWRQGTVAGAWSSPPGGGS